MKTMTRSNIYLPIAAMIVTTALAIPAAAQKQVLFKGTFQGQDVHNTLPPGATTVVIPQPPRELAPIWAGSC